MIMAKKVKPIRIRISETQFRLLVETVIAEQRSISSVCRDALNNYLLEERYRNETTEKNKQFRKDE